MKQITPQEYVEEFRPKHNPPIPKTYTSEEVCAILCEGCKRHLSNHYSESTRLWTHYCNGVVIPCLANDWRRLSPAENAKHDEIPTTPPILNDAERIKLAKTWEQQRLAEARIYQ